jgi:hypothetical protein
MFWYKNEKIYGIPGNNLCSYSKGELKKATLMTPSLDLAQSPLSSA